MDHIIDNRLNRSLAIHDLDNLVFEKRQRKTVQPTLYPIHKQPTKKPSMKKKEPSPSAAPKIHIPRTLTKTKGKQPSPIKKKSLVKKRNNSKPSKKKNQSQSEIVVEQSIEPQSSQSQKVKKSIVKPKPKQALHKKQLSRIKQQSQSENEDMKLRVQKKSTNKLKPQVKQVNKVKQQDHQEQNNELNLSSQKRGRGRPKKTKDIINQLPQAKAAQEQIVTVQKRAFQQAIKNEQHEIDIEPIIPDQNEAGKIRSRKAKMKPVIRYNQNDEDAYSEQSFDTQKDQKKKKKIAKAAKTKNKQNKPYSLNRIFRKEAKKNFPAFQLNVNLGKLSLKDFVKQFGVFDLIHFSLPVQYLQLFPDMPILMDKGFVFLWVEKKQTQVGYHLLNRWGYDVIDQIIWVKSNEQQGKVQSDELQLWRQINDNQEQSQATELFLNMKSTCLVGYKCPLGNKAEYRTKVSNNIIFAKSQKGVKKPQEIYQIADLMMPGAKKLEFGGQAQKGWLNLKHHQLTLYRCQDCLKEQNLYFLEQNPTKKVLCKKCIIEEMATQQFEQQKLVQILSAKFKQLRKLKIKQVLYTQDIFMNCPRCDRTYDQISLQGFVKEQDSQQHMCIDCYNIKLNKTKKGIQIVVLRKNYYSEMQIQCSQCKQTPLIDLYFECSKCKNHKLCKNCFWSLGREKVGLSEDEIRKANKQIHQWKLKLIKNSPVMRFWCYQCKKEMNLPFWSCQTCQSWMWCGKCQRNPNQIHPHYQTDKHNEYLMI